ncbi:MAG: hypothetical protein SOW59_08020 [Corynebacterium sp.]|nr:hypothetical protein [Corynebacterium sp.]
MQKEILVGLLRGETWSSYRAFQEFKQAKEKEVRSAITDLLHRGLLEETNSEWVLADALLGAETPQPKTKQHNLAHIATLGANTEAIFRAVSAGKQAVSEIMASTGLSENQVRYGLKQLVEAHEIAMIGGRGVRGTRYQALLS